MEYKDILSKRKEILARRYARSRQTNWNLNVNSIMSETSDHWRYSKKPRALSPEESSTT